MPTEKEIEAAGNAAPDGIPLKDIVLEEKIVAALEAAEKVRESEWQDISTAPKDGTEFLGFEEGFIPYVVTHFKWIDGHTGGFKNTHNWCSPTHWKPLPTLPKKEE